jgi:2-dehydropantoate 2-reductase
MTSATPSSIVPPKGPILIWGAGAIGGTIGAYWVRAGHEVVFVDLVQEHVDRIRAGALDIHGPVDRFTVGAPAFHLDKLEGRFPLVMLAVKAQHTQDAVARIAHHLTDDGAIVSAQNGINEPVIAGMVGAERTIGAFVNFGADWLEPGVINYGGRGAVVVGEIDGVLSDRIRRIHRLFLDFDDRAVLSDNIFGYLWSKLAYLAILSAGALTNETTTDFLSDPRFRGLISTLAAEVLSVAKAERVLPMPFQGFDPLPFAAEDAAGIDRTIVDILNRRRGTTKHHSGMWRDLAVRKRPTEVPWQYAPVKAAAARHGIATPMLDGLIGSIADIEAGRRENSVELALELAEGRATPARAFPA